MSSALDSAAEILLTRKVELEHDRDATREMLREIEAEIARIDGAVRSLRGSAKVDRSVRVSGPAGAGVAKTRAGSVKDLVIKHLEEHGPATPQEIGSSMLVSGQLEAGREGSVRTALWQLRKDGVVDTDPSGKSALV
jgi:hypothetical protein